MYGNNIQDCLVGAILINSDSRKIMNKHRQSISPYIFLLSIGIGLVLLKCSPKNVIIELEYIYPIRFTRGFIAFCG